MRNRQLYPDFSWSWVPKPDTHVLLFDIETNGLLNTLDRIHCICIKDFPSGESFSFGPGHIEEGLNLLSNAELIVAHNGLCFDAPAIHKLYPSLHLPPLFDTLTCSRVIWPNLSDLDFDRCRKDKTYPKNLIGAHKLKAWGYRLGVLKGLYGEGEGDVWDHWTPEMEIYCMQDVVVLEALYKKILEQEYDPECLALEHEFQKVIFAQEQAGVYFDVPKARALYDELAVKRNDIVLNLHDVFPPKKIETIFIPKVNNKTRGYVKGVPFTKVSFESFNPSSRQQIIERLKDKYGWSPSEFTETGQAKIDEDVLATLPYEECKPLIEYLELVKIMGMLAEGKNGWLKLVDSSSRIHGRVITNGAITGRCTHNAPNLAQIPAHGKYGTPCRELFAAPAGRVQVGTDASGLELRMLASYLAAYDGGKYVAAVLSGDIHTANQKAAGLPTRDKAKTFIYAFNYGAGDAKLGSIVLPTASIAAQARKGKELKAKFFRAVPALKQLLDDVAYTIKTRRYLYGIDGRKLYARSAHSALNTLLQSAGAVLMKFATIVFHVEAKKAGFILGTDYEQVLHVHDEWQCFCKPEIAEELGKIAVHSIEIAGQHFGMACPTTGEFKVGKNWAETH